MPTSGVHSNKPNGAASLISRLSQLLQQQYPYSDSQR
jgi:hypothetical protein